MARRNVVIVLAASVALIVGTGVVFVRSSRTPSVRAKRVLRDGPNVLFITLDTTRADRLGCYGYDKPTSPHLDHFAARGTLFTYAFNQAAVTPVSHASMFTGLEPYEHGLRVLHGKLENRLADSIDTLAEVLQTHGYKTAAFVSAFPVTERFGLNQGFGTFDADFLRDTAEPLVADDGSINTGTAQRRADATTDRALSWLTENRSPFFLWLHYFDPHDSKVTPPPGFLQRFPKLAGFETDVLRNLYDIEITYMDEQIDRVLSYLREGGQLDDMVVVIASDHGEGLGDHNWWTHGILYQEQVHMALMIRAPGMPAGRSVDHLVRSIDIMPTLLDLVGVMPDSAPQMSGRSLVPMLQGEVSDPGSVAYCDAVNNVTYETSPRIIEVKTEMLFAVIEGRWKYIHHLERPSTSELYRMDRDPTEAENLFAVQPDVVQRLRRNLMERPFTPYQQLEERRMDPADIARLKSLGYVGG